MAADSEDRCPICLDSWDNAACTVPCLHRFCFSCIRQWAEMKPECPLCKRRVTSIRHSLRGDEFEEFPIRADAAASGSAQGEGAHGLPAPRPPRIRRPRGLDPHPVGGLQPSTWGHLFREHPGLLQLLRPWLRQELGSIFGQVRSQALMVEHVILSALPVLGLHEWDLVEELQDDLEGLTTGFVRGLLQVAVERCARAAYHLVIREASRAATGLDRPGDLISAAGYRRWQEGSPVATTRWTAYQERREGNLTVRTSSNGYLERGEFRLVTSTSWAALPGGLERSPGAGTSPAASRGGTPVPGPAPSSPAATAPADELPGASTAALQQGPGCAGSVPAPIPGEQEELPEGPREAAAGASAPSLGRGCSRCGPRRPLKRKASSSEDSAVPAKRPRRR